MGKPPWAVEYDKAVEAQKKILDALLQQFQKRLQNPACAFLQAVDFRRGLMPRHQTKRLNRLFQLKRHSSGRPTDCRRTRVFC